MITWPAKDPQEVADYSWQPPLDAGDAIATFTALTASGVSIDSTSFTAAIATVWVSGGTATEIATFTLTVTTTGGRTFETTAILKIADSAAPVLKSDTLTERLAEAEAALHALATGARVADVMRDGRRVTYSASNMAELQGYINWLRSEIEKETATETGRTRRRAIGLRWQN